MAFIVRKSVFSMHRVNGISMNPTLNPGDSICVNRTAFGLINPFTEKRLVKWNAIKENDIILFHHDGSLMIKRCIATENSILEHSDNPQYNMKVNGRYLILTQECHEMLNTYSAVPENHLFVLGDNDSDSIDSRNFGFICEDDVLGRVISHE